MLGEPHPTQADVHFNVAGFPVRVHPFFWVISLLLGLNAFGGEPVAAMLSVAIVFASILVHELGHAFLQRKFGGRPRIVLHGFGGLAICGDCDRSPRSQILISLAGPAAGFLLAAAIVVFIFLTARHATFVPVWMTRQWAVTLDPEVVRQMTGANLLLGNIWFQKYPNEILNVAVSMLLWINIYWGLMNLLPVYPLDGGQVARELFTLGPDAQQGVVRSLQLSIGVAVAAVVYALTQQSLWMAILFGLLAYNNWQTLQAYIGRGPGPRWQ